MEACSLTHSRSWQCCPSFLLSDPADHEANNSEVVRTPRSQRCCPRDGVPCSTVQGPKSRATPTGDVHGVCSSPSAKDPNQGLTPIFNTKNQHHNQRSQVVLVHAWSCGRCMVDIRYIVSVCVDVCSLGCVYVVSCPSGLRGRT